MTSPNEPDRAAALGTAQALAGALNGLSERLDTVREASEQRDQKLTDYGRANRHRIWLTYGLLAVDIGLTVIVGIFAGQAHSAATQAHSAASAANQTRQAETASCTSGNELRGTLTQVFDHVFNSFGPAEGTPAQRAREVAELKALEAYYRAQFAPRDCTAIYRATTAPIPPKPQVTRTIPKVSPEPRETADVSQ